MKKILITILFLMCSLLFAQNERKYINFMLGYNYAFDFPIGLTIGGLTGLYTSWNFNFSPLLDGVTSAEDEDISYGEFTGETTNMGLEFVVGYSIYLKNKYLRIPIGIGMSITDEYELYNENGNKTWYGYGNMENKKIILEAGLQFNITNFLYLTGSYRTIGLKNNSFSIGLGYIRYSNSNKTSTFTPPQYFKPEEVKGRGIIKVNSTYTIYQQVMKTDTRLIPGSSTWIPGTEIGHAAGGTSGRGGISGSSSYIDESPGYWEEYTYTVNEPIILEKNIKFAICQENEVVYSGITPITVSNIDPGVTYRIIWTGINGIQKENSFVIPLTSPFTKSLNLNDL